MQQVSETWRTLWASNNRWVESRLLINSVEYSGSEIMSLKTYCAAFGDSGNLQVGKAPSRTLEARVRYKGVTPPDMAEVKPQIRLTNGTTTSEWIEKGHFYIDKKRVDYHENYMTISAYDAIMKLETAYNSVLLSPALDRDIVDEIAALNGLTVDPQTVRVMTSWYEVNLVDGWTQRDALGAVAALYAGNFITSDTGQLRLVSLFDAPSYRLLGTETANTALAVGGVLIGV